MTSRERFTAAINHKEPDRVPIFAHLTPAVAAALGKRTGVKAEKVDAFIPDRISYNELLLHLGNDAVGVGPGRNKEVQNILYEDGSFIDEWGFTYKTVGSYVEIVKRPLASASSRKHIREHAIPSPHAPGRWEKAKEHGEKYRDDYALVGCLPMVMFELSWNLIGFEKFLMDFISREPYVLLLMDKLLEYNLECSRVLIDLGIDVLWTGDDVGTQEGMLIGPELWREMLKPRMTFLYSEIKKMQPDIKILYHSCGSIRPIIPDLIEIGLDILNPIQPLAKGMDLGTLKKEYGKDLCFCGGVDVQKVLPTGTPAEVAAHVGECIEAASWDGGYIAAPAHVIQPDTPIENILTFFEAAKSSGNR